MRKKIAAVFVLSFAILFLCIGIGSVFVSPLEGLQIVINKIFSVSLPDSVTPTNVSIFWDIRMPRALTAFLVGAALSVSGAIMQALLQNPLASSYTMGVSAGASLGAAFVIITGVTGTIFGMFLLPVCGFASGLLTVLLVLAFSLKIDRNMHNHTIILFGMVFSLFVNAILTLVSTLNGEHMQRLVLWQLGTFSGRRWIHVLILLICLVLGTIGTALYHRELDIMSFGQEQAMSMGVDVGKSKIALLLLSSFLTGAAVCFSGIIGFVDLTVPHIARRIFGAKHALVIPMSLLLGGAFMALSDMVARTLLAPREIPVGAVTALVGAPFFVWVYFHDRKQ